MRLLLSLRTGHHLSLPHIVSGAWPPVSGANRSSAWSPFSGVWCVLLFLTDLASLVLETSREMAAALVITSNPGLRRQPGNAKQVLLKEETDEHARIKKSENCSSRCWDCSASTKSAPDASSRRCKCGPISAPPAKSCTAARSSHCADTLGAVATFRQPRARALPRSSPRPIFCGAARPGRASPRVRAISTAAGRRWCRQTLVKTEAGKLCAVRTDADGSAPPGRRRALNSARRGALPAAPSARDIPELRDLRRCLAFRPIDLPVLARTLRGSPPRLCHQDRWCTCIASTPTAGL